jgi:hypothetical protein
VPPTRALFEAVLNDVTDLQIRGEYAGGVDALDNVRIVGPLDGTLTTADFRAPAGDFSTLVKNPDGSFTRRLKDGTQRAGAPFASADVAPPAPRSLTNCSTATATRPPRSTATATPASYTYDAPIWPGGSESRPSPTRPAWSPP